MTTAKEKTIAAQVLALQEMGVSELREQYLGLFGEETKSRNRVWLFRSCAWRLQELAFGGLSERAKRRAKEIVRECDVRPRGRKADQIMGLGPTKVVALDPRAPSDDPPPGSMLVREYKGRVIRVRVLESGYEFDGQPYRSLSAVAKAVTGSHWNGRAFFGLGKTR